MGIGASYSLVFRAHLALALAATLFGGLNVVLEVGLARNETTSTTTRDTIGRASTFALYRDVGAAVLLLGASACTHQWQTPAAWVWRDRRLMAMVFACGFCGIYAQLCFIVGLALTDANLAALFQPTAPVVTVLFSVLAGAERLSPAKAAAIVLALCGAVLMVDVAHASAPSLLGAACFVVNLCGIAAWLAIQKLVLRRGVGKNKKNA